MQENSFKGKLLVFTGVFILLLFLWQLVQAPWFFQIKTVTVKGCVFLSRQEVMDWAGFNYDDSLLKISPKKAEKALMENPWVSEAVVSREFPSTVVIEVAERSAVVVVPYFTSFLAIAEDGTIVDIEDDYSRINLPIVSGIELNNIKVGQNLAENTYWPVLQSCIDYIPHSFYWQISEIAIEENSVNLFTLDGMEVKIGDYSDFNWDKLRLLPEILDHLPTEENGFIDLTTTYAVFRKYTEADNNKKK